MRVQDYMIACEYIRRICSSAEKVLTDEEVEEVMLNAPKDKRTLIICHTFRDAEEMRIQLMKKCGCCVVSRSERKVATIKGHVIKITYMTRAEALRGMSADYVYVY